MTLTAFALAGVGLVLFLGALVQRVTGMGMALVAAPLLVLLLGATTGVQTLQVIGLFTCLASAMVLRRDINLRRAGPCCWLRPSASCRASGSRAQCPRVGSTS